MKTVNAPNMKNDVFPSLLLGIISLHSKNNIRPETKASAYLSKFGLISRNIPIKVPATVELDKNTFEIEKGQKVLVEMGEKNMVISALIVYLFPLIALIAGYFISFYIFDFFNIHLGEIEGIIGGIVFLGISFLMIKKINQKLAANKKFQPQIVEVIE